MQYAVDSIRSDSLHTNGISWEWPKWTFITRFMHFQTLHNCKCNFIWTLNSKSHSEIHQLYSALCLLKALFSLTSESCFLPSLSNTRSASQPTAKSCSTVTEDQKNRPTLCLQLPSGQQIISVIIKLFYYYYSVLVSTFLHLPHFNVAYMHPILSFAATLWSKQELQSAKWIIYLFYKTIVIIMKCLRISFSNFPD